MRLGGRWNRTRKNLSSACQGSMRSVALVLCVLMVEQPLLPASTPVAKRGPTAGATQAKGEGRVLHALNRLTFGPRPGDVAAVEAMGLTTWFDMQLNPAKIDDSALEAKLAAFPAMQLPQGELLARYPSQQMIRQMEQANRQQMTQANGPIGPRMGGRYRQMAAVNPRMGMPTDPVERAIYADQMAFYKLQQEKQAEAKTAAPAAQCDGRRYDDGERGEPGPGAD